MLELNNIEITFNKGTINERKALNKISLHVKPGDFITIIGSNGAGKSTLLNCISGSYEIDYGNISLDKEILTYKPEHYRAKHIGRLFQDPLKGTAPHMSIEENLALAYSRGKFKNPFSKGINKADRELFKSKLALLNLQLENRITTNVGLLSGGQRQALTLLMATIVTPKLLLLDEHTAALDPNTANKVMEITKDIVEKNKITTLMITHNIQNALDYGNKTIVMNQGEIVMILEGEERKTMTVEKLMKLYTAKSNNAFSDNMIL